MTRDDLPPDLVRFVAANIDSVEQILILQLLCENSGKTWTVSELTNEIRSTDSSIGKRLQDFYQRGVLLRSDKGNEGTVAFSPASREMESAIKLLITTFKERPSRVVAFIYSQPPKSAQAFADSFRFGKDKK